MSKRLVQDHKNKPCCLNLNPSTCCSHALPRAAAAAAKTRQLTCPHHPSEAEAAPHPWPRLARGRPCHRCATGRAVQPEDRHLEDDGDRTRPQLLTIGDRNAGEFEREMHSPARFMMKVLEALVSWTFSNSLRRISGGSRTQRFRRCSSGSSDTSEKKKLTERQPRILTLKQKIILNFFIRCKKNFWCCHPLIGWHTCCHAV